MARIGELYRCSANDRCLRDGEGIYPDEVDEQHDRYGIYAGLWHDSCWEKFGYGGFVFDPSYAGEALEAEDY